jgi:hypothetical protein
MSHKMYYVCNVSEELQIKHACGNPCGNPARDLSPCPKPQRGLNLLSRPERPDC